MTVEHAMPMVRVYRDHRLVAERELTSPLGIGRHPDNELVLDDELVSGHHGRIDFTDGAWVYTDLGSTNGSIVAAGPTLRKGERHTLHEDSQILIGATVVEVRLGEGTALIPALTASGSDSAAGAAAAARGEAPGGAAGRPKLGAEAAARAGDNPAGTAGTVPAAAGGVPGTAGGVPGAARPDPARRISANAPPVPARIVVAIGPVRREFTLTSARSTLGRGAGSDVLLEHPSVSSVHAEIAWEDGRWVLRDLSSTNGTRVGLRRLRAPEELRNDSHLILGEVDALFVSAPGDPERAAGALRLLARDEQLGRAQAREARDALARGESRLGAMLVLRGWISPGEWSEALAASAVAPPRWTLRRWLGLRRNRGP